jgi:hypothetical protein
MPWAAIPPLRSDYTLSPTSFSHKGDDDDDDNDFRCVRINSEKRLSASSCTSYVVRLSSAYISAAPTERMVVKFDTGEFHENL